MSLTAEQIENIQIDYGLVYIDFGETGERRLAPTKGGGTFKVTKVIRDIEFDGRRGKTKGMQVVDEINAVLSVPLLDMSMANLNLALPFLGYAASTVSAESGNVGLIADSAYLTNITLFAKLVGGGYKKIVLYNPMNEGDLSIAAAPKSEGIVQLEVNAHWDAEDDDVDLFTIEDVETIGDDVTGPTVITVPDDGATEVVVSDNLTATFNEAIREADVNSDNFRLIKASDGSIVAGTLAYTPASYLVTFNPTDSLAAGADYIWSIAGVRDTAGNKMTGVAKNFTTAS